MSQPRRPRPRHGAGPGAAALGTAPARAPEPSAVSRGEPFDFLAEKLVYGGEALGYHQGHPVLAHYALPGERVRVEPVRRAKGVIHARLLKVFAASPERIAPRCPYFGRCGGCHYQNLAGERQVALKIDLWRETLRRLGKITWQGEIRVHTASPWHYRNRIQLKVARGGSGIAIGFHAAESRVLVPVDHCPIASPRLNAVLGALRSELPLERLEGAREFELFVDDRDEEVMLTLRGNLPAAETEHVAKLCLERLPGVVSVAFDLASDFSSHQSDSGRPAAQSPRREPRVFGRSSLTCRVGAFAYRVSPGAFFQVSFALLPQLARSVAREGAAECAEPGTTAEELPAQRLAMDLYAGVGLLTLPLAQRFERVLACEPNRMAAADLAANAHAHGLANVSVAALNAFDFLRRYAGPSPDLVVVDPPRSGVDARTAKLLSSLAPRRITYVSCHPPTLARDLAFLARHGYRLDSAELFDFFPQTCHIESLVRLSRSDARERGGGN